MNKKFFLSFIVLLIFISYIFNVDKIISNKLSTLNMNIKSFYLITVNTIDDYLSNHFNQANQIKQLKYQVSQNEKYKILYSKNKHESTLTPKMSFDIADVISYKNFNNSSKVLLKTNKNNINNISALITEDGYSAGIMVKQDSQNIGLLNHHEKANYAVFIGDNLIAGITHGSYPNENIVVKYVPVWQDVKINDEVITSGMDNIFYKGVKVGYVVGIKSLVTTKEVMVKPYANVYRQKSFYLYSKDIKSNIEPENL